MVMWMDEYMRFLKATLSHVNHSHAHGSVQVHRRSVHEKVTLKIDARCAGDVEFGLDFQHLPLGWRSFECQQNGTHKAQPRLKQHTRQVRLKRGLVCLKGDRHRLLCHSRH